MSATERSPDARDYECDRCAASLVSPLEHYGSWYTCDCGGAWIDVTGPEPMLGEPESDFPTLAKDDTYGDCFPKRLYLSGGRVVRGNRP